MISALTWIPRGAARAHPVRFELSADEVKRIETIANDEKEVEQEIEEEIQEELEDDDDEEEDTEETKDNCEGLPAELRMDEYDDEEVLVNPFESEAMYDDEDEENEDDEDVNYDNLHISDAMNNNHGEMEIVEAGKNALAFVPVEDEEDIEDDEILPTDHLMVLAITEDDYSHLEVQVLTENGQLYTHHDILLPDFPLSLAWMDIPPYLQEQGQQSIGNYIAVGTFSPGIEIWNLDVLDALEPSAILGGPLETTKTSKKKKKNVKPAMKPGSHDSSVLGLSWNTVYRQALASASADQSVKIWDVTTQTCSHTFHHHHDKVQSVSWHPQEAWLLATGGFDKKIGLIDCRTANITTAGLLPADIESLVWNPFSSYQLYGSLENGTVICLDIRKCSHNQHQQNKINPFVSFQAHQKTVSSLAFSPNIPGLLTTASLDKTIKVWDVNDFPSEQQIPRCIAYKTMNVGKLFAMNFSYDDGYMLAAGGDQGIVAVWESDEMEVIQAHFEDRKLPLSTPYSSNQEMKGKTLSLKTSTEPFQLEILNEEPEDDSWMDDNTGIATNNTMNNNTNNVTDGKKKKKKKPLK